MSHDAGSDRDLAACVRSCESAERGCNRALSRSLELGGAYADPEFLRLLLECSRSCARSAQILLRGWWDPGPVCLECAELCEVCETECGGAADPELRACAEACRACAACCRRLAAAAEPGGVLLSAEDDAGDAA